MIPACAGRIVEKEVRELDEILSVAKAPHVVVLGGSKVADRLEAISLLIKNGQADHIAHGCNCQRVCVHRLG